MNKKDLIVKCMTAVSIQQTDARNQYRTAADLNRPDLMTFWESQIEEHEATYKGLLDWLYVLAKSGGDK